MTAKPKLYYTSRSPPCRSVLLAAKAIGVELELIQIMNGEHRTPKFLKMNPQQTIPVLDDNGLIIVDNHVICGYLSDKYAKDDKLYPRDIVKRALVDARMHFDMGFLLARIRAYSEPVFYFNCPEIPQEKINYFKLTLPIVESFFENGKYICGDAMTLADFCFIASLSSVDRVVGIDGNKYPKLIDWMKRMSEMADYGNLNGDGAALLQQMLLERVMENRAKIK